MKGDASKTEKRYKGGGSAGAFNVGGGGYKSGGTKKAEATNKGRCRDAKNKTSWLAVKTERGEKTKGDGGGGEKDSIRMLVPKVCVEGAPEGWHYWEKAKEFNESTGRPI